MPQLNPEFFISQLFWLTVSFTFLFIFLWRISLPRISSVLEKRESKINDDIATAKQLQAEAEEIQEKIDSQLREAKIETVDLIKTATFNFQNYSSKELEKLDKELATTIDKSSSIIEKNKIEALQQIYDQIYDITKLTLSKISSVKVNDDEIKKVVDTIHKKVVH